MANYFQNPFRGIPLSEQVTNPNITVGKFSYYSGYYHGHSFDDCARYLLPDRDDVDKLIIGSYCSIASGVSFIMCGNQGHRHDWISSFPFYYMDEIADFEGSMDGYLAAGNTVVGNDVWIGAEAMIMPGITIGDGAVIGSRALVSKNVEPYCVVGGNPAREIRKRFSDEEIAILLAIKWWTWEEEKLRHAMPLLSSGDIPALQSFSRNWQSQNSEQH